MWKKSSYNNAPRNLEQMKQELVIKNNYIMNSPFDNSMWVRVDQLKNHQLERINEQDKLGSTSENEITNIFNILKNPKNTIWRIIDEQDNWNGVKNGFNRQSLVNFGSDLSNMATNDR